MIGFVIIAIIVLDQGTKFILDARLRLHDPVPVIKGILYLTLVHNKGAAFGILRDQLALFVVTSFAAIVLILVNLTKIKPDQRRSMSAAALSLIFAGAVGNLIDRLRFGYVVDFIDLQVWPVFNIADSAITIGAILLGISLLRDSRLSKKNRTVSS